jgi:hypothetical protein
LQRTAAVQSDLLGLLARKSRFLPRRFGLSILTVSDSLQPSGTLSFDNRVADGEDSRYERGESSKERADVALVPLHAPRMPEWSRRHDLTGSAKSL